MPAVERSPWGSNWVDLMNQYSYRVESQFDPLDLCQSPGERFRRQRPVVTRGGIHGGSQCQKGNFDEISKTFLLNFV